MKNGNEANPAGQNEAVPLQSVKDGGAAGGSNSSHDGEDNRAETRETKDKAEKPETKTQKNTVERRKRKCPYGLAGGLQFSFFRSF